MEANLRIKPKGKARRDWLKNLKSEIMESRYNGLEDSAIKKICIRSFVNILARQNFLQGLYFL